MTLEVPGLSAIPSKIRGPAMAGVLFGAGHFATKKTSLRKVRTGVLVGLGLNLIDTLLSALAPPSLKSMFGLAGADEDIYGPALADYVAMDDYVALEGAPPIENHLTLSDYIAVGDTDLDPDMEGLESELGNIEQDLGAIEDDMGDEAYEDLGGADAYQDLGDADAYQELGGGFMDFANRKIGGVNRRMMRAPIRRKRARAPVPRRRFTRPIPRVSHAFDEPAQLYTGIFSGGFGR